MNRGRSLKFGFALAALSLAGWATSHANAGGYCGRPASSSYYYNSGFSYGSSYGAYPVVVAPPAYSSFGSYSYYNSSRSYCPTRPSGFGFSFGFSSDRGYDRHSSFRSSHHGHHRSRHYR